MWAKFLILMLVNSLSMVGILSFSYMFAFWSLPFMGDEPSPNSIALIVASVALLFLIDVFSIWRFKKLNAHFTAAGGGKLFLWIYQGLFVVLVAGANVLVGFVGVFYLIRLFTDRLA